MLFCASLVLQYVVGVAVVEVVAEGKCNVSSPPPTPWFSPACGPFPNTDVMYRASGRIWEQGSQSQSTGSMHGFNNSNLLIASIFLLIVSLKAWFIDLPRDVERLPFCSSKKVERRFFTLIQVTITERQDTFVNLH